jgi:hypothetical protein
LPAMLPWPGKAILQKIIQNGSYRFERDSPMAHKKNCQ